MKKAISILLIITFCFSFISCSKAEIISKKPIDKRFTAAHTETMIINRVVIVGKVTTIQPMIIPVNKPDKYEIEYLIVYDDETEKTEWEEVEPTEFENIVIKGD